MLIINQSLIVYKHCTLTLNQGLIISTIEEKLTQIINQLIDLNIYAYVICYIKNMYELYGKLYYFQFI